MHLRLPSSSLNRPQPIRDAHSSRPGAGQTSGSSAGHSALCRRLRQIAPLLLLSACLPLAGRAATFVQVASATPQSPKATVSVAWKKAQTAGNLNIVVVGWNDTTASVVSVQDSAGNLYHLAIGPTVGTGLEQSIYYAPNIAGGTNTVTVTFTKAATYPDIRILEYKGAGALDVAAGSKGSSATTASGAATTTVASDLIFAAGTVATGVAKAGSGFTSRIITSPDSDIAEDKSVTAVGSYSASATLGSAGAWVMQMTAFSASTGTVQTTLSSVSCSAGSETGAASDACTVTLSGAAPTGGLAVTLGSNDTAVTVPASITVPAGSTSAGFTASAAAVTANQTAALTAAAAGVSKTFSLSLKAYVSTLTVSSTSIAFGDVQLNTPATQSVTLTASGTAPVTVSAASVSGSEFSASGLSLPVTLPAGQSATLSVQFKPTSAGAASGTVNLASNCSMGAMAVSLSGTGTNTDYAVNLSWDAPAASSDPVAGYNIYRTAAGGSYQLLNATVNAPTSFADTTVQNGVTYSYEVMSVDAQGNESVPSNVYTTSIP